MYETAAKNIVTPTLYKAVKLPKTSWGLSFYKVQLYMYLRDISLIVTLYLAYKQSICKISFSLIQYVQSYSFIFLKI